MGRRKRMFTAIVDEGEKRLAGLMAIDPALDLGNGLSITGFNEQLDGIKDRIVSYNAALSTADKESNAIDDGLKALREFNRRMLAAIGAVYGYNSNEYEMVGGTRASDIKRNHRSNSEADDASASREEE
jgi:hypothetical protein